MIDIEIDSAVVDLAVALVEVVDARGMVASSELMVK